MADVVAFGELLVDFVPAAGPESLIAAEIFKKAAGGARPMSLPGLPDWGEQRLHGHDGRGWIRLLPGGRAGQGRSRYRATAFYRKSADLALPSSRSPMASVISCSIAAPAPTC